MSDRARKALYALLKRDAQAAAAATRRRRQEDYDAYQRELSLDFKNDAGLSRAGLE